MSVRKRGRRKISCNNETYIWYIELDYDSPFHILNIVSEDKSLIIACPLNMKIAYVISKGKRFQNNKINGRWNRYSLPFQVPEIITPKFVSELILWSTQGSNAIKIQWDGERIPV